MSYLSSNNTSQNFSILDDSKFSTLKKESYSGEKTIYQFKVILIGEASVGKTSILNRFILKNFSESYNCTIVSYFKKQSILIDPYTEAQLNIWDTCGQERYKSVTKQFYIGTQGVILIYDINNKKSFEVLNHWINEIKSNTMNNISLLIVGNKADLERKVSFNELKNFSENKGLNYIEVSAKNGINIDLIFEKISKEMIDKLKTEDDNNKNDNKESNNSSSIQLNNEIEYDNNSKNENIKNEKKGFCC